MGQERDDYADPDLPPPRRMNPDLVVALVALVVVGALALAVYAACAGVLYVANGFDAMFSMN